MRDKIHLAKDSTSAAIGSGATTRPDHHVLFVSGNPSPRILLVATVLIFIVSLNIRSVKEMQPPSTSISIHASDEKTVPSWVQVGEVQGAGDEIMRMLSVSENISPMNMTGPRSDATTWPDHPVPFFGDSVSPTEVFSSAKENSNNMRDKIRPTEDSVATATGSCSTAQPNHPVPFLSGNPSPSTQVFSSAEENSNIMRDKIHLAKDSTSAAIGSGATTWPDVLFVSGKRTGVCKTRRDPPSRGALALCWALAREGLVMMFMSPTILSILAYLGMAVETVSRGSLRRGFTSGQVCAVLMLMAGLLPVVQANHDLVVEMLDSEVPISSRFASHWRKENTSSPPGEQDGLWRAMQEVSACSTGMHRPTALDSCTVCEAGTFDDDNDASTPCVSCETGTSSLPGASECPFVRQQNDMATYEFPPFLSTSLTYSYDASISVTTGDFNGDGMLDALVANFGQANVFMRYEMCGDGYSQLQAVPIGCFACPRYTTDTRCEGGTVTCRQITP